MKATGVRILFAGLVAFCTVACQQAPEAEVRVGLTIGATTESSGTKTVLSGSDEDGYDVLWSAQDSLVLAFYGASSASDYIRFDLVSGAGETKGEFISNGVLNLSPYTRYEAFYGLQNKKWPRDQFYGGENVISAPMFAKGSVTEGVPEDIKFHNLGGVLRLKVRGSGTLKSIKLSTKEYISGLLSNDFSEGAVIMHDAAQSFQYITLDLGESGVQLNDEGTFFYFNLPAGEYSEVRLDFKYEDWSVTKKLSDKKLVVTRGRITPAAVADVDGPTFVWFKRLPYGEYSRSFHAGDSVKVCDRDFYQGKGAKLFFTGSNGGTAHFRGQFKEDKSHDTLAILAASRVSISENFDTEELMPLISLLPQQSINDGQIDPMAEVAVGRVSLSSTESNPVELQNLLAIISFNVDTPVGKVVFTAHDSSSGPYDLAPYSGVWVNWNSASSKWQLTKYFDTVAQSSVTVTSSTLGGTLNNVKILVLPQTLSDGYTIEFYETASSRTPLFSRSYDTELELKAGEITELGKIDDATSGLYIRYDDWSDFLYIKNGVEISSGDPVKNSTDCFFVQGLDTDYSGGERCPAPGQMCDLHIYIYGSLGVDERPVLGGDTAYPSGKSVLLDGIPFQEYVVPNYLIPDTAKGDILKATLSASPIGSIQIKIPYCLPNKPFNYSTSDAEYVFICSDEGRYVRCTGKDYDYNLVTDTFSLKDCMWRLERVNGALRISQVKNGKTYWLQHQSYRQIAYISKDSSALDLWANWEMYPGMKYLYRDGHRLGDVGTTELYCYMDAGEPMYLQEMSIIK